MPYSFDKVLQNDTYKKEKKGIIKEIEKYRVNKKFKGAFL